MNLTFSSWNFPKSTQKRTFENINIASVNCGITSSALIQVSSVNYTMNEQQNRKKYIWRNTDILQIWWKLQLILRRSGEKVSVAQSCLTLCNPMDCSPLGSSCQWDLPGKNIGVGCHSLLQGIFLTQGSNLDLLHCRQIFFFFLTIELSGQRQIHGENDTKINPNKT